MDITHRQSLNKDQNDYIIGLQAEMKKRRSGLVNKSQAVAKLIDFVRKYKKPEDVLKILSGDAE